MQRNAIAIWTGTGKEGKGHLTTQSNVLDKSAYSFSSRFGEDKGTNPEELIGAALAGCFSMKLSFLLTEAGFPPQEIKTTASLSLDDGAIKNVQLELQAQVANITHDQLVELATQAKTDCPVAKLLNADISLDATLIGSRQSNS